MLKLRRYWINQPSTLQHLHAHHGARVLAEEATARNGGTVYFADNTPLISLDAPSNVLSEGWPTTTSGGWGIYCPCGGMPNEQRELQPFPSQEAAEAQLARMRSAYADSGSIAKYQWNAAVVRPWCGPRTDGGLREP